MANGKTILKQNRAVLTLGTLKDKLEWISRDSKEIVGVFEQGEEKVRERYMVDPNEMHSMAVMVFTHCLSVGLEKSGQNIKRIFKIEQSEEHFAAINACVYNINLGTHDYAEKLMGENGITKHDAMLRHYVEGIVADIEDASSNADKGVLARLIRQRFLD